MATCYRIYPIWAASLLAIILVPQDASGANEFQDCTVCPVMIEIPPGQFNMGSKLTDAESQGDEVPEHTVKINYSFAVGKYEVSVKEYQSFISETGTKDKGCYIRETIPTMNYPDEGLKEEIPAKDGSAGLIDWIEDADKDWESPGYPQGDDHPVVCVNWYEAVEYTSWLSQKTGKSYRLLTEAEWEYSARAGTKTTRYWDEIEDFCQHANLADITLRTIFPDWKGVNCKDGSAFTAMKGSFKPNDFGLYDMLGNVLEMVDDCWVDNYSQTPIDGSSWLNGECSRKTVRSGSWFDGPRILRSANRYGYYKGGRNYTLGFRVARAMD